MTQPGMAQGERISWKRISVEAAAIVISILLAFGIDAAWDARNERNEEARTLETLLSELELNQGLIALNLAIHDSIATGAIRLLNISRGREAPPESHLELVLPVINALIRFRTTDLTSSSGSAVLASGNISLVRDAEIRSRIAGLASLVEDALEGEANQLEGSNGLFTPYVLEHLPAMWYLDLTNSFAGAMDPGEQWPQEFASQIEAVLGSDELEGLLGLRINAEGAVIRDLRLLHAAHVELIEMIRTSLGMPSGQPGSA